MISELPTLGLSQGTGRGLAREGKQVCWVLGELLRPAPCLLWPPQPVDLGLLRPWRHLMLASLGCGPGPRSGAWAALCVEEGRQGPRSLGPTPSFSPSSSLLEAQATCAHHVCMRLQGPVLCCLLAVSPGGPVGTWTAVLVPFLKQSPGPPLP